MKDYLLGLLDGSSSLSHEGIGLVIQELNMLRKVVDAGEYYINAIETPGDVDAWKIYSSAIQELRLYDHTALSQEIAKDLGEEF